MLRAKHVITVYSREQAAKLRDVRKCCVNAVQVLYGAVQMLCGYDRRLRDAVVGGTYTARNASSFKKYVVKVHKLRVLVSVDVFHHGSQKR
jgi:hypothetical protein